MCHIGVSMGECNGVQLLMPYTANLERSILATPAGIQISKFLDTRFRGYVGSRQFSISSGGVYPWPRPVFKGFSFMISTFE
jgi:hypothetical protein